MESVSQYLDCWVVQQYVFVNQRLMVVHMMQVYWNAQWAHQLAFDQIAHMPCSIGLHRDTSQYSVPIFQNFRVYILLIFGWHFHTCSLEGSPFVCDHFLWICWIPRSKWCFDWISQTSVHLPDLCESWHDPIFKFLFHNLCACMIVWCICAVAALKCTS